MAGRIRRKRRSYSKAFKRRVIAKTLVPGASVAAVALHHGLNANMVFMWRRDPRFGRGQATAFLPVWTVNLHAGLSRSRIRILSV